MATANNAPISLTVNVPVSLVGLVIGKKGSNIKEINDRSGARCWVDNTKIVEGCKLVEITGNDLKSVNMAKQIIESQLGQFKMQNNGSGTQRGDVPGLGVGKGRRGKKNKKKRKNKDFVFHGDDLFQSGDDEEKESDCNEEPKEDESKTYSNVHVKNTTVEEQRLQEEAEKEWDLREASMWARNNLWGVEGSKTYSVGCATTAVCSKTGRMETLPYPRLAEMGTHFFKRFKEQLENEKYENWKEQAGRDWRMLMMKANKLMEKNLCKAVANYNAAFCGAKYAGQSQTARSLARNLLVSFSYLAIRVMRSCRMDIYCQAVDIFKSALELDGSDETWLCSGGARKGVLDIIMEMVEDVGMLLPSLDVEMREMVQLGERFVSKLGRWTTHEQERKCLGLARVRQGEAMFNKAAMAMGDKNYSDALYLFQELYSVVEEAKRHLRFPDEGEGDGAALGSQSHCASYLWQDLRLLITDIRIHTSLAEALKAVHDGDVILQDALESYETLQLELVYSSVDKYRLAVTLARGEDIEIMCIAFTKIASVYIKVFKDGIHKSKAKEYLNDVMEYSKVMSRNLYAMEWYKEASTFLKNMQDDQQRQEDELWQNKRKVFMDQLTEELKTLELHKCDSNQEFLIFLFAKFPPKHRAESEWRHLLPQKEVNDYDSGTWKKTMMKLVTIYHPDRVDRAVHSDKYHVLCEEITKELTNRYQRFK